MPRGVASKTKQQQRRKRTDRQKKVGIETEFYNYLKFKLQDKTRYFCSLIIVTTVCIAEISVESKLGEWYVNRRTFRGGCLCVSWDYRTPKLIGRGEY